MRAFINMCDSTFELAPQILLQKKNTKANIMKLVVQNSPFIHLPPHSPLLPPHILNTLSQTHSVCVLSSIRDIKFYSHTIQEIKL
jgi:hypothetical protein